MDEIKVEDRKADDRRQGRPFRHVWAGLFLLLIGSVLMLDQLGFPLPDYIFTWPMLLIALGLFVGLRHGFRGGAWFIFILIGSFFLMEDHFPHFPLHRFFWPVFIIVIGLLIIIRPGKTRRMYRGRHQDWHREWENNVHQWKEEFKHDWKRKWSEKEDWKDNYADYIDSTAILGGVHRKIVTKNFKGGDVTSVMGGTELDFTQADFTGTITLDVTQVMGGTKIIVPGHWEVRSEVSAIFAGFEDKRQQSTTNPDKILIITGISIMGGIELRNY